MSKLHDSKAKLGILRDYVTQWFEQHVQHLIDLYNGNDCEDSGNKKSEGCPRPQTVGRAPLTDINDQRHQQKEGMESSVTAVRSSVKDHKRFLMTIDEDGNKENISNVTVNEASYITNTTANNRRQSFIPTVTAKSDALIATNNEGKNYATKSDRVGLAEVFGLGALLNIPTREVLLMLSQLAMQQGHLKLAIGLTR